ncbi:hypothetical protein FDECE_13252 [Fusarium decemcellulare]|nr:hypothetical protein FDECE_13252 [Fusarium decemcellulare]
MRVDFGEFLSSTRSMRRSRHSPTGHRQLHRSHHLPRHLRLVLGNRRFCQRGLRHITITIFIAFISATLLFAIASSICIALDDGFGYNASLGYEVEEVGLRDPVGPSDGLGYGGSGLGYERVKSLQYDRLGCLLNRRRLQSDQAGAPTLNAIIQDDSTGVEVVSHLDVAT